METGRKIAVAGATGRVGRHVVDVLESEGHEVVPISRSGGVDVVTGDGLADALASVECVIDAATGSSPDQAAATEFFAASARNLQEIGARAGVERIVMVSIIGIDRFTAGYSAAKLVHEQALLAGPIPARILRASQFHEFIEEFTEWGRQGDVISVPRMRIQPVAARAVAEEVADLASGSAGAQEAGAAIPEIAGPREERLADLARLLAARRGDPVRIEEISNPDDPDHALYETDALLPGPDAMLAGPTFEEWLDATSRETASAKS